jgi:uncharacterized coiled-coil protein SlyX
MILLRIKKFRDKGLRGGTVNKINLNNQYNQSVNNKHTLDGQPAEIKNGETYLCTVKEKKPGKEAIIKIKGKELTAKFESAIPRNDRFMVEVVGVEGDKLRVKAISPNQARSQANIDTSKTARDFGGGSLFSSAALKEATAILAKYNVSPNPTEINCVKSFLRQGTGSLEDKLDTIRALASKGLEISPQNLRAVHEALHGQPFSDVLQDLAKDLSIELKDILSQTTPGSSPSSFQPGAADLRLIQQVEKAIRQLIEQLTSNPQVGEQTEQAIKQLVEQVINNSQASEQIEKAIRLLVEQLTTSRPGELENAIKQLVEQMGHLQTSQQAEQVSNQRVGEAVNAPQSGESPEKATRPHIEQVTSSSAQSTDKDYAHNLKHSHKPSSESSFLTNINPESGINTDQTDLNELWQASPIGKDYLITEITKKLSQVAKSFTDLRREVVRNLENINRIIHASRTNAYPQVKPLLESTIDLLDRAILKSDLTLYTDLQTEKHLMVASSRLAEARKLLAQGSASQAAAIVEEVKQKLEVLNWRPVINRAIHTLPKDGFNLHQLNSYSEDIWQLRQAAAKILAPDHGARNLFETLRALGLNHDSEVGQALTAGQSGRDQPELRENLKAVLLKLSGNQLEFNLNQAAHQKMAHILDNLTGQQLLSKFESSTELQSMFFNLAVNVGGDLASVKVFINSRKERQKIDWANCNIYFLIKTKELGETGIQLTAVDSNLTLTLKNDRSDFVKHTERLVDKYTSKLQEVGYNVVGVNFARLNEPPQEPQFSANTGPSSSNPANNLSSKGANLMKGFDFKA